MDTQEHKSTTEGEEGPSCLKRIPGDSREASKGPVELVDLTDSDSETDCEEEKEEMPPKKKARRKQEKPEILQLVQEEEEEKIWEEGGGEGLVEEEA